MRSTIASLKRMLNRSIERQEIENILEPVLVDDVLILPEYAFGGLVHDFSKVRDEPGPGVCDASL